jgi:hypothetical protein|tara:strand:- start:255 stop:452 length:198 start_codon:yes stop_codon:yes gene_type:complete
MDGNIRLALILSGIGLMLHAGYLYANCMITSVGTDIPCDAETAQAQLEGIFGIVLFVGMMRKSKD